VPRPDRVVVDQQHPADFFATHPAIQQHQRVRPSGQTMLSQPIPSQLGQVLPFLRCQKAAANHGAEKNPSTPVWQAVFSTSHGAAVYTKGVEVISISEAVAKYRAAVAERDRLGPDVVVIARTDTRAAIGSGLDEVLRRCEAYLGAGVDMLMVMALQSREEMRRVVDAFPGADVINASSIRPALSDAEYVEMG
jgi:hypothetical protein